MKRNVTPLKGVAGKVTIRKNRDARLLSGHPWVFAGEVYQVPPPELDGQVVAVEDHRGIYLGQGLVNSRSSILVRLLSRQRETIDRAFFKSRLEAALRYRERYAEIGVNQPAYRLVHAEADGMPAFVVDRYDRHLVVQVLSLGMAQRLPMLVELLAELVQPAGIYERSDQAVRQLEGLEPKAGLLWGEEPGMVTIDEGGARFLVDIQGGQKTGFFLDQRLNRARVRQLSRGRVLNTFCYTGGFSIAAALGEAREVVSVDISGPAIKLATENAALNGVQDKCRWIEANAFDTLREMEKSGERFDVVILDPPAFTKNKDSIPGALRGYKEINLRAMRLLEPGGLLVSASCSHHLSPQMFVDMVASAGHDTRKRLRQIELRGASPDHPVLPAAPETNYLKCLFTEVH